MPVAARPLTLEELPAALQPLTRLGGSAVAWVRCSECGEERRYFASVIRKALQRGSNLLRCLRCHNEGQKLSLIGNNAHRGQRKVHINSNGYIVRRNHAQVILEHRLVAEYALGRILLPTETIHHLNGDRQDNRPENLELWDGRHGRGQLSEVPHCSTCTCEVH